MPPTYIRDAAKFARSIILGTTTEGLYLDFKQTIDNWNAPKATPDPVRQKAQKELCRDVSQFANTDGGCLLIGVDETKNADGIKLATSVARVDDPDGMRAWIEQAIANYCVPTTFSKTIDIVQVVGGPIVAVNIPPNLHTVYVWDRQGGSMEVIGRTNHGKKFLNPDELERHIMNGSRATRLAFDEAAAAARNEDVILVGGVMQSTRRLNRGDDWYPVKCDPIRVHLRDQMSFQLSIPVDGQHGLQLLSVPYELIRACWVDVSGRLNVFLHVRTIWESPDGPFRFADGLVA